MANFNDLLPLCATDLGKPAGTMKRYGQALRAAGCVSATKRGRGGADITTTDAVRTTIAALLSSSDTRAAGTVTRVCALPLIHVAREGVWPEADLLVPWRAPFQWLAGIAIGPLDDLGEALCSLIDAMRTDAFDRWAGDEGAAVYVDFHNEGANAYISILPRKTRAGVILTFGVEQRPPPMSTITRIDNRMLVKLATTLGPPEAPPPPY
ncbi:hypothetical protein [Tardiphaga sp.]|uniref:hypothetical protein n=1 Tax=Tardiphaga sp. TaxID=1926292 RepID=UPI002604C1B7|nr:hypothetical protein [Tardiphaga sp.]MDB5615926.1 hypothetical protein [Tardiphaga sp.]